MRKSCYIEYLLVPSLYTCPVGRVSFTRSRIHSNISEHLLAVRNHMVLQIRKLRLRDALTPQARLELVLRAALLERGTSLGRYGPYQALGLPSRPLSQEPPVLPLRSYGQWAVQPGRARSHHALSWATPPRSAIKDSRWWSPLGTLWQTLQAKIDVSGLKKETEELLWNSEQAMSPGRLGAGARGWACSVERTGVDARSCTCAGGGASGTPCRRDYSSGWPT